MEELKKELLNLVYTYTINKKVADKEYVTKAIELCIQAFNVSDYVTSYEINSISNNNVNGGYLINKKSLIIDIQKVIVEVKDRVEKDKQLGIKISEFLDLFIVNLNIIYGVVHELTHAYQYKKCLEGKKDIEREILEVNLDRNLVVLRGGKLTLPQILYYRELDSHFLGGPYYEACPSERMAHIRGLEFERDISKLLDPELKGNIESYTELRLLNGQIEGYRNYSPTAFVTMVNETLKAQCGLPHYNADLSKIEAMYREKAKRNHLSFDERYWLGLPITESEKQKVYKRGQELQNILLNKN